MVAKIYLILFLLFVTWTCFMGTDDVKEKDRVGVFCFLVLLFGGVAWAYWDLGVFKF